MQINFNGSYACMPIWVHVDTYSFLLCIIDSRKKNGSKLCTMALGLKWLMMDRTFPEKEDRDCLTKTINGLNSSLLRTTQKCGKLMIKSRKAKEVLLLPIPFLINFTLLYLDYWPGVHPDSCRGDTARVCFHNSIPQTHGALPCFHANKGICPWTSKSRIHVLKTVISY